MNLLTIILVVLFAIGLGIYLARRDDCSAGDRAERKSDKRDEKRRDGLAQIVSALERNESGQITNNDVEALLGVSDATATRYMSELEAQGKVSQVGSVGKGVYYTLS